MSHSLPLQHARVALIYGPGNLGIDFAASLLRGIERAFLELGARVATLNEAFYRWSIEDFARRLRPGEHYPPDAPLTRGIIDFLETTWSDQPFDICFGLFYDIILSDALLEVLRRRCRRIINYPLNLYDQPELFERATEFCDETYCSEEDAVPPLRERHGKKVRYVPMAADPYTHRPIGAPEHPRLLFVGTLQADRAWLLERCMQVVPTSIYGANYTLPSILRGFVREFRRTGRLTPTHSAARMIWHVLRREKRIVSDEEFVRLASVHGVSVGFASAWRERTHTKVYKVRLRDYEATMTGLCHIAKQLPELERGFEDEKEILFYREEDEIVDILRRIRRGSTDWRAIGSQARRRAIEQHTWTKRLSDALGR